jgi:hypothetical protein
MYRTQLCYELEEEIPYLSRELNYLFMHRGTKSGSQRRSQVAKVKYISVPKKRDTTIAKI